MRKIFTVLFLLMQSILFGSAGFTTETAAKINIQTTDGIDNYQDMTNLSNYSGTYTSTSYFHLKASEAWVFKNNGSDITGVTFYYRVYKQGITPPSFSSFNLPFGEENSNGGTTYQRWGNYSVDIDLLQSVNEQGTWIFECYYAAATNGVDSSNPELLNNGGSNYSFTFQADASLPVELTTFTAFAKEKEVVLNWQTATEVNNYGFYVERLAKSLNSDVNTEQNNAAWKPLGFVEGHGNSNSPKTYSYSDNSVNSGKYLYRLKQVDNDGSFEYSKVVEVNLEIPTEFELAQNYPNPFNPTTTIKFSLPEASNIKLTVYNVIGEKITELLNGKMNAGYHSVEFGASSVSKQINSGVYIYSLQTPQKVISRKMILMK